jgi:hypothetical protein
VSGRVVYDVVKQGKCRNAYRVRHQGNIPHIHQPDHKCIMDVQTHFVCLTWNQDEAAPRMPLGRISVRTLVLIQNTIHAAAASDFKITSVSEMKCNRPPNLASLISGSKPRTLLGMSPIHASVPGQSPSPAASSPSPPSDERT